MTQQLVFTKTRILTVKVATLVTFLSMVKTLDQVNVDVIARWQVRLIEVQTSLTQKLVPLLSKIRTKEPAVTVRFGLFSLYMIDAYAKSHRWRPCPCKRRWV
jgi:hypothetical protein